MKIDIDTFLNNIWKQNCGDSLKVIEKTNTKKNREFLWKCIFQKYPYEVFARKGDIIKGSVLNPRIEEEEFIKKFWFQNCGDVLKIIEKVSSKNWQVSFLKYPYITIATKQSIIKGAVLNPRIEEEEFIGKEFFQHCGDSLIVLEKTNKKDKYNHHYLYKCQFKKYPCLIFCQKTDLIRGKVDNPLLPLKTKEKLEQYILTNFKDKKPTLDELSASLGFGYSYVCHKIKEFNLNNRISYQEVSKEEEEMRKYCISLDNSFLKESTWCELDGKEIDVYSPKLKLGIEFNGDYWHSDEIVLKTYGVSSKERDLLKYNLAKEKGIDLYFIWEHDWKGRQEVVKRYLRILISKYNKLKLHINYDFFTRN